MDNLERKLIALVNSESAENDSNTPDWILGQYMMTCLKAFNTAVQQREQWYGRDPRPIEQALEGKGGAE